jgi:hypothetical protein
MQIVKSTIKSDSSRDNYWARILLKSSENKQTFLFVCASHEYIENSLKTNEVSATKVNELIDDVIVEWQSKGNSIFNKPFHLEVRAVTQNGYENGIQFLKNEIVPIVA